MLQEIRWELLLTYIVGILDTYKQYYQQMIYAIIFTKVSTVDQTCVKEIESGQLDERRKLGITIFYILFHYYTSQSSTPMDSNRTPD